MTFTCFGTSTYNIVLGIIQIINCEINLHALPSSESCSKKILSQSMVKTEQK